MIVGQHHAGMVHSVAYLTLFGYSGLILRSLVCFVFHPVLV